MNASLHRWDVWQRLDSEFFSFLVDQRQIILWLKRTGQFFPYIEEELERADLPDDLKYVTIVESGLRAAATSAQVRLVFGNLSNQPAMLMIWSKIPGLIIAAICMPHSGSDKISEKVIWHVPRLAVGPGSL